MAIIDHENKAIQATICYVGGQGCGKLANLEFIDREANAEASRMIVGQWIDHAREMSHTTVHLETEHGYHVELSLHGLHQTPDEHPALANADAIVVVVDSTSVDESVKVISMLRPFLERRRMVVQYNKRDMPGALSVEDLSKRLQLDGVPTVEAVAKQGVGVFETLRVATQLALAS